MNVDEDHAEELATFVSRLDNELIVDELSGESCTQPLREAAAEGLFSPALQSIYDAIRPYTTEGTQRSDNTRYVIQTT